MSGVYIDGLEMPTDTMIVAIRKDGMVEDVMGCCIGKAIPVPDHGRLVDADDVNNHVHGWVDLRDCPTIIPADKEAGE